MNRSINSVWAFLNARRTIRHVNLSFASHLKEASSVVPWRMSNYLHAHVQKIDYYEQHVLKVFKLPTRPFLPETHFSKSLMVLLQIGLSRGTRGTRSPSYPTHFHSPIPRGMNFGSPRFPDSPPIIPRFPEHWKISRKNWIISEKMNKIRKKK